MAITAATFISDVVLFTRDTLRTNLTDPLSRTDGVGFVMTSFPKRNTTYPVVTVKGITGPSIKLGMRSELRWVTFGIEVKVFARNVKELDELTQETITILKNNQYGTGSSDEEEIHDFNITSVVPVEPDPADELTVQQNVIGLEYKVII